MSLHISKNSIRATGKDANGLFIALMSDRALLEAEKDKTGGEEFRRMVKEAIALRGLNKTEAAFFS
jgi:hypothetical protein